MFKSSNNKIDSSAPYDTNSNKNNPFSSSLLQGVKSVPVKSSDVGRFKTAKLNDYDLEGKNRKVVTKNEYSGGFRVPIESLNKPYMINKCWKEEEYAGYTVFGKNKSDKFTREEILQRLGLDGDQPSGYPHEKRSRSNSKSEKNRGSIQHTSSSQMIASAEKKLKQIHSRRDYIKKEREQEQKEGENLKKKRLVVQDQDHQDIFVTLDPHKITMVQSYIHQLELRETIQEAERKKLEKEDAKQAAKELKKQQAFEKKLQSNLTPKEMRKQLRFYQFMRDKAIHEAEQAKIAAIKRAYFSLNKKDFDLCEFTSPNEERVKKENEQILKEFINKIENVKSSAEAFSILVDRILFEIKELERMGRPFSSLSVGKTAIIKEVSPEIVEKFFVDHEHLSQFFGYNTEKLIRDLGEDKDSVELSEIGNYLYTVYHSELEKQQVVLDNIDKEFEVQCSQVKKEFENQIKIVELAEQIKQAKQELKEMGIQPLDNDQIDKILQRDAMSGGQDFEIEANNPQMKPILLYKQMLALEKQTSSFRRARCTSTTSFKLTVPDPYEFDERDRARSLTQSIRQKKVAEFIAEIKQKDLKELSKTFHAHAVPDHVKNVNLLDEIMNENEKRREAVRLSSIALTQKNERPFSFYERDKQNQKRSPQKPEWDKDPPKFKAIPIPREVTEPLYKQLLKEAADKRKQRVEARKEELLTLSSLPPRMAEYEQKKKQLEMRQRDFEEEHGKPHDPYFPYTFEPEKAREVPNFDKLQKDFENQLEAKKGQKKSTQPEPFNFQESVKIVDRDHMDYDNLLKRATADEFDQNFKKFTKTLTSEPFNLPASTKKATGIEQLRKSQVLKREQELKEEEKIQKQKLESTQELKKKFYASPALQEDTEARKQKEKLRKKEQKQFRDSAKKDFNKMIEKVKEVETTKPLLVEKYNKDMTAIEKAKEKYIQKKLPKNKPFLTLEEIYEEKKY